MKLKISTVLVCLLFVICSSNVLAQEPEAAATEPEAPATEPEVAVPEPAKPEPEAAAPEATAPETTAAEAAEPEPAPRAQTAPREEFGRRDFDPRPSTPFDKGNIFFTVSGGLSTGNGETNIVLGAGLGYFVINGLELGGDFQWRSGTPDIFTLTPRLTYYLYQIPVFHPFAGVFYRHWFITDGFDDADSYGVRMGAIIAQGPLLIGAAAVYERLFDCSGNCSDWYPEVTFGATF